MADGKVMLEMGNGASIDFVHYMKDGKARELLRKLKSMGLSDEVDRCFKEAKEPLLEGLWMEWLSMTKRGHKQPSEEKNTASMAYSHVTEYGELIGVDDTGMLVSVYVPAEGLPLYPHDERTEEPRFTAEKMEAFYSRMLDSPWDDGEYIDRKSMNLNILSSDAYTIRIRGKLIKRDLMKKAIRYLADPLRVRYDGRDMLLFQSDTKLGTSYVFMRHYTF